MDDVVVLLQIGRTIVADVECLAVVADENHRGMIPPFLRGAHLTGADPIYEPAVRLRSLHNGVSDLLGPQVERARWDRMALYGIDWLHSGAGTQCN